MVKFIIPLILLIALFIVAGLISNIIIKFLKNYV